MPHILSVVLFRVTSCWNVKYAFTLDSTKSASRTCGDLGAAQSSISGSARNFFGSLSRLEPNITAQQQACTQS